VTEVIVFDTGRQHEIVVGKAAACAQQDLSAPGFHADSFIEPDRHVACVAENGARRLRDFGGRKRRSGHLIQQRLKKVMIAPVNQDDVDWGIAQVLDQGQTSETTPHNHHALPLRGRSGGLDRWSHLRTLV
jgi:hypothetical protein